MGHILKTQDSVKYDAAIDRQFTLKEMKFALDPLNDYSMLTHVGQELDEFVEMYYQPCVAALFGMNVGTSPDTEPQYFMAYGWLSHSAWPTICAGIVPLDKDVFQVFLLEEALLYMLRMKIFIVKKITQKAGMWKYVSIHKRIILRCKLRQTHAGTGMQHTILLLLHIFLTISACRKLLR